MPMSSLQYDPNDPSQQVWDDTQLSGAVDAAKAAGVNAAKTVATAAATPATTAPDWTKDPQWAHLDPRLTAIYVKNNRAPSGPGTGFTDANYWNDKLREDPNYDFLTRLDKDLQGVGTDRSTGTVWGAAGAPAGVDQNASDTANYSPAGAQLAGLANGGGGIQPVFDVTSQGTGPGSYAWRQQQIYALQQRLINGGSR